MCLTVFPMHAIFHINSVEGGKMDEYQCRDGGFRDVRSLVYPIV